MGRVIAIDGPSGAGKSTIARQVAERLGFIYLDTGALYRGVALWFLESGVKPEDDDSVLARSLKGAEIGFRDGKVMLNGRDVSAEIRTPDVGHYSSVFSARKVVRDFLLDLQRKVSHDHDLVVEGRDTTTVIFPGAELKFYMDASVSERARRRHEQLRELGLPASPETAERDVIERDARDRSRDIAPLRKAEDAIIIDTTGKGIEEVLGKILSVVRSRLP